MKKIWLNAVLGTAAAGIITTSGAFTAIAGDLHHEEKITAEYNSAKKTKLTGKLFKEDTNEDYASKEVLDGIEVEKNGSEYIYTVSFKKINIGSLYKIKYFTSVEDAKNRTNGKDLELRSIGQDKSTVTIRSDKELKEAYFLVYFDSIKEMFPGNYEQYEDMAAELVRLAITKNESGGESEPKVKIGESVKIKVTDGGPVSPDVRRAVDSLGRVIEKDGKKHLRLKYYSKNENVVGDEKKPTVYDYGLRDLRYSYEELESDSEDKAVVLEKKVVETGKIQRGEYVITEVDIPIDGKDKVYLYGKVLGVNGQEYYKFGVLTWEGGANIPDPAETKVDTPQLLNVKQLGLNIKSKTDERLEYDFEKDGEILSPYMSKDGKKFKLSEPNHALSAFFKRDNLDNTKLRYIRYTLDGSEPDANSPAAGIGFRNNSANILANKFYEIVIDPLNDVAGFTKNGGDVTLKVKGFNADNNEASETKKYVFTFDSYSLDEVAAELTIGGKTYHGKLDTNRAYGLTEDVRLHSEEVGEKEIREALLKDAEKAGIKNASLVKLRVLDSKGNVYRPYYKNEWNEDRNPLMRLALNDYPKENDSSVFVYKNGEFRPVAAYRGYTGVFYMYINQPEGFYVIGKTEKLLEGQIEKLEKKVKDAEEKIKDLETSKEKVKVQQEIEAANKLLSRPKWIKLEKVIRIIDNIDKYIKALDNALQDNEHLSRKAKALTEIADSPILKELLTDVKLNAINDKKEKLKAAATEDNIKALEEELDKLEYKHPSKEVGFRIRRYDDINTDSMANGVFDNTGRLIFAGDKTYLEMNLKTMTVLTIRAHLLHLSAFKDNLDSGQPFNVYSVGKFDDVARDGSLGLFDKKILLELTGELKQIYNVRVDNDGMPGANPQAKLSIEDISKDPIKPKNKKNIEFKVSPANWTRGQEGLEFKANASKDDLISVKVDGAELSKGDYKVESGSTVITLKKEFLSRLKDGKHVLKLEFKEGERFKGGDVAAEFEVKEKEKTQKPEDNKKPEENSKDDNKSRPDMKDESKNGSDNRASDSVHEEKVKDGKISESEKIAAPKTGDSKSNIFLYAVSFISLGGIITGLLFRKRKRNM